MSKYLCQDCKSNNNGWCTVRRCNGLKKLNVTSCNTYEDKYSSIINVNQPSYPKPPRIEKDEEREEVNTQAYRVLGKREMLWNIQMQIFGINEDAELSYEDKYKTLVENIKSIGTHLNFEEQLWSVEDVIDSMIDEDMIRASKIMTERI